MVITKRCLPGYSLVHTKDGLKKIKDIKEGDKVMTSKGYRNVIKKMFQGKQELSTIYTSDGEFKCTPNHRMAVVDNICGYKWVEAQDIKEGDLLLTNRRPIEGVITKLPKNEFHKFYKEQELTPDIAWFIGLFNEAGNYNTDYIDDNTFVCDLTSFNITIYGYELINSIKIIIKKFDNNANCTIKRLYDENIYTILCNSEHLSNYFNKYFKNHKSTVEIPEFIKEGTLDVRKAYIAGIIDGNINNYDNGFVITKTNKKRADDIQALCYSCGFETTNTFINNKSINMTNILKISTYFSMNVINSIKELHKKINYDDIYHGNSSFPVNMVKDFIEDEYNTDIISDVDINNKCVNDLFNKLNMDNFKRININDFDKHVLTLNYCPSIVTKIVFDICIVEETYDIEVEDKHEFYCNGYLTHNSSINMYY
jgi:ribonucleotide reductase class II